jgi:hypothetical protein
MTGPDGRDLVDLVQATIVGGDTDAPARFLARWDSALIAYDVRDRILPEAHHAAVVKKNGDFLPSILVDGLVAGLWSVETSKAGVLLTIAPFAAVPAASRRELEAEGERLMRFIEPDATGHAVAWASAA